MRGVIVMTACNRADYTKEVLISLSKCIGIENYLFLPHVEPMDDSVIEEVSGFDGCETSTTVNGHRLGHTLKR